MATYKVNINSGFKGLQFGEEFEPDTPETPSSKECEEGVKQGYLVTVTPPPQFTKEAETTTFGGFVPDEKPPEHE